VEPLQSIDDWARLQELFDGALQHEDPAQREAWLAEACREQPELRAKVESLLLAVTTHTHIGAAIGAAAASVIAEQDEAVLPGVGGRLGPYQITDVIGRGGMGVVYRAIRADDEYRKQVAIKATRGLLTPELRQRFLTERQILANLDHPNIARLLDGGTTPEGMPYVVMEYVDGQPVDTWCQSHNLNLRDRVRLAVEIALAVDYAHRHLIVHRDLKPDNIHVTEEGIPKLLDFGIAKALNPEWVATSSVPGQMTTDVTRLLTPDYASPEQVRGEPVTTATDVYQLGILFYRLFTNRRPFQASSTRISELERLICDVPPPKPGLSPDLDQILLHALEKDPLRRYPSAGALAGDLDRYLNGFPVEAHATSLWYRTRKFVERNRIAVVAAALVALLIVGFSIGMAVLSVRLAQQRNAAERELQRAAQVSRFLETIFTSADPDVVQSRVLTARDLLDEGVAHIDDLKNDPQASLELLDTFGNTYGHMGLYVQSEALLLRSLALRRRLYGDRSVQVARCLDDAAESAFRASDFARAIYMAREARDIYTQLKGRFSQETAVAMDKLITAYEFSGDTANAVIAAREGVTIREKVDGPDSPNLFPPLVTLGRALAAEGTYDEAEKIFQRSLASNLKSDPGKNSRISELLTQLGLIYTAEGRYSEAEKMLQDAIANRTRFFGPTHNFTVISRSSLARLYQAQGRYKEAGPILLEALAQYEKNVGPQSRYASGGQSYLGKFYEDQRQFTTAESYLRQALETRRKLFGPQSVIAAHSLIDLVRVLAAENKTDEAARMLDEAKTIFATHPTTPLEQATLLIATAHLESAHNHWPQAKDNLQKALALYKEKAPLGKPDIANTEKLLATIQNKK